MRWPTLRSGCPCRPCHRYRPCRQCSCHRCRRGHRRRCRSPGAHPIRRRRSVRRRRLVARPGARASRPAPDAPVRSPHPSAARDPVSKPCVAPSIRSTHCSLADAHDELVGGLLRSISRGIGGEWVKRGSTRAPRGPVGRPRAAAPCLRSASARPLRRRGGKPAVGARTPQPRRHALEAGATPRKRCVAHVRDARPLIHDRRATHWYRHRRADHDA